jgi:hypothetical protein
MKPMSPNICVVCIDVEAEWEEELDRWYTEEHIPALMEVPGYLKAERFRAVEGEPKYMAWYELETLEAYRSLAHDIAIDTPWTHRMREHFKSDIALFTQMEGADGVLQGAAFDNWQTPIGGLLVMRSDVKDEDEEEFNRWYREEHLPGLMSAPGALFARRYKATEGGPRYLARYDLTAPEVSKSAEWDRGAETPWTFAMREKYTARWLTRYVPVSAPVAVVTG